MWRGAAFFGEAVISRTGASYAPHSRLGWRGTETTPGCHPGLHEAAALQLYKDGLYGSSSRITDANRSFAVLT